MKKLTAILCLLALLCPLLPAMARAEGEETSAGEQAVSYCDSGAVTKAEGIRYLDMLFDGDGLKSQRCPDRSGLILHAEEGIGSVYFVFDLEYGTIELTDDRGDSYTLDTRGFLHQFADVERIFGHCPRDLAVRFTGGDGRINEMGIFGRGETPDWVQKWEQIPDGGADLMLFSAHGDDDQLFFAGLLPWYGAEMGMKVQVVYMTDHRGDFTVRVHEMLDGLWAVGIKYYPVFGRFRDHLETSLEGARKFYHRRGNTDEEMVGFVVEQLRRFRPYVAVGHDVNGEYGHGMHMLYAEMLMKACAVSEDGEQYPELAEKYGVWDVPKTYLHLYWENPIIMDWDRPMESFGGMTAYEVTRYIGYPCHVTQVKDYNWYYRGHDTAADIRQFSPCEYGLYRSTVGEDVEKNDFFENIVFTKNGR